MNLKITTLIENNPNINSKLYNEHGLSLYIEIDEVKILFDTGQSGDFIENAEKLNVDLNNLKYVILSHGHYDHSGGFRKLVDKVKTSYKLVVGKGFFNSKYKLTEEGNYRYIGNSFDEKFVNQNNISIKYIEEDIFYITEDIMIFSNFKRSNDFELINKKFLIKQDENYVLDNFSDEIVLAVKTVKGLIVIVGCSHIGIVNILETIIERTGMPIYGIIGGTHLIEADQLRLNNTINFLKEKDIQILGMSHCTGEKAVEEIKREFGKRFLYNNTGNVIKII
ncbi:MAG: MBL fold metallo-hydrolase [Clostridiaceae bacterium]